MKPLTKKGALAYLKHRKGHPQLRSTQIDDDLIDYLERLLKRQRKRK